MKVSIIIPTMRTWHEIKDLFHAIHATAESEDFEVIYSGMNWSASKNRNFCLNKAKGDIIIQVDDDVSGFYQGWDKFLIAPLMGNDQFMLISAELHKPGTPLSELTGWTRITRSIIAGACIAHRKTHLRYDEEFKGSGMEDNDFCMQVNNSYPNPAMVINYNCKLYHAGEKKLNKENLEYNTGYYQHKWHTWSPHGPKVPYKGKAI